MPGASHRENRTRETRDRIAAAALKLFLARGYTDTTIDDIAAAAGVSRRTVFHHFATKDAMLFDHLAPSRDLMLELLEARPASEPLLQSLHAVLREMCTVGHDRDLLAQIRMVITREPRTAGEHLWGSVQAFQKSVTDMLAARSAGRLPDLEVSALTRMAFGWYITAAHFYLIDGRPSLLECFDQVVTACSASASSLRY